MHAIVLDGDQRPALAVTRSLGQRGIIVTVGAERVPSLSSCSRFCQKSFLYPSPYHDPAGFIQTVIDFTKTSCKSILLPMTDVTLTEILLNRKNFPEIVSIPFVDYNKYSQLTDKIKLFRLGKELNIPIPTTFLSPDFENLDSMIESVRYCGFPVVVKPSMSKIRTKNGWLDANVQYASDEKNLRKILLKDVFKHFPFLIQKRIEGAGVGVFLLMKEGEVIEKFAHRRIREKPPSGGVSVLCESIELPPEATNAAIKILAELKWTGVAMVEFKIDQDQNVAKLLEVNARFWGSLQLAISSGIDFPYLLYSLIKGEHIEAQDGYTVGLKSRWELGDLDHLFIRLINRNSKLHMHSGCPPRITLLKNFVFDFFRESVKNEVFQSNDKNPFFYEMKGYIKHIFG